MRIGNLSFANNIALAPMAGISDPPFRALCAQLGAGITPAEMVSADVGLWQSAKSSRRLRRWRGASTQIVQIVGYDPGMLAEAARQAEALGAAAVDINMGCPAKKVCRQLAGSALLRDPGLVSTIFRRVVGAVGVPVTAKIRTGWSPELRNGIEISRIAEEQGIAALTVHGRTRACKFTGSAEYETIRQIKQAVGIPVIANGDIDSPEKAREVLEYTGADGIMIGRAARGRPWLFAFVSLFLQNEKSSEVNIHLLSVRDIILQHLDSLYSFYGEFTGVRVSRKHLAWYTQDQEGGQLFRERIMTIESAREQLALAREFFDRDSFEASAESRRSWGERGGKNSKQQETETEQA
jgi:tRNA-dihydrouridine synthase B